MAARILSLVAFQLQLSFLSGRTSAYLNTPKNVFESRFLSSPLEMVKLRSHSQCLSRRHQRKKTAMMVSEGSRSVVIA